MSGFVIGGRPNTVSLYLSYESNEGEYYALFKYSVPKVEAGNEPILPLFTKQGIGSLGNVGDAGDALCQQQFQKSSGSMMLTFPEKTVDGKYNRVVWRTRNRAFILDTEKKKVAFYVDYNRSHKFIQGTLVSPPPLGIYIVYMHWDDEKMLLTLYVNKILIPGSSKLPQ